MALYNWTRSKLLKKRYIIIENLLFYLMYNDIKILK